MKAKNPFRRAPKPGQLPSSWRLFMDSMKAYLDNWWPILKIMLVVTVPVDIINLLVASGGDNVFTPFLGFAQIIMNVAMIYAIAQTFENRPFPRTSEAYYDGSAIVVRYLLVAFLIVLMLLPAIFGLVLVALAFIPDSVVQIGAPEQAIMSFLAFLFTLPTFYLLIRNGLGLVAVVRENLRPFASLRASRLITRGRFWRVAARFVGLFFVALIVSLPTGIIAFILYSFAKQQTAASMFFQLMTTLTTLPITTIFAYKLYLALEAQFEDKSGDSRKEYVEEAATAPEDREDVAAEAAA